MIYALFGFLVVTILLLALLNRVLNSKWDILKATNKQRAHYKYSRKKYLMTRAENGFYHRLAKLVDDKYVVFPQVHLASLLGHKIKGQDWRAALSTIQRKSVDFVICESVYLSPLVAIELDDWSHERDDRKERDDFVERVFAEVGLPLIRFAKPSVTDEEIRQKLAGLLQLA